MSLDSKIHLVISLLMVGITACFYRWQPRTINSWYGYRTPRSMKSQAAWTFAQQFGSRGMLLVSLLNLPVHALSWWWLPSGYSTLLPLGTLLIGILAIIIRTEQKLKQLFPS